MAESLAQNLLSEEAAGVSRVHGALVHNEPGMRFASVAVVIGVVAAVVAGATIWLLLTEPVTVANAVDAGEISPLVISLAEIIYNALATLLDYL